MARPSQRTSEYILEDQVGFLIRRAHQRASGIFSDYFKELELSPVQFAALTKIADEEPVSQNQLGRLIHMDPATTMAMIHRLCERELVLREPDPNDGRRVLLRVRPAGRKILVHAHRELGPAVTADTLSPLAPSERAVFLHPPGEADLKLWRLPDEVQVIGGQHSLLKPANDHRLRCCEAEQALQTMLRAYAGLL